ncbi:hypothetical protein ACQ86D_38515 [Streptomyces galilaeus]
MWANPVGDTFLPLLADTLDTPIHVFQPGVRAARSPGHRAALRPDHQHAGRWRSTTRA